PVSINGISFNVHVKLVRDSRSGKITSVKPEFEDIRIIASRTHVSVKRTMELVNSQVMQKVG
ncbi:MAG: hypothetical protein ACREAZ_10435, partial [Nitrososphaera sp.]